MTIFGKKISDLPAAGALAAADVVAIVQSGVTVRTTLGAIKAYAHDEDGTWTPGLTFGGAAVGMTFNTRFARYQKRGRMVSVQGYIPLTAKGSSVGNALFMGIPFPTANVTNGYTGVNVTGGALSSISGHLQGYVAPNGTDIVLQHLGTGTASSLSNTNFGNSSELFVNFDYSI